MTALVEDLLLARLDSGRPLEREPVDLSRLLLEAVIDARVVDPDHQWRLSLPDAPLTVTGDAARLHQVVTNLLTNSRKYTLDGSTVTVTGTSSGFTVHDDGPGFSPADRAVSCAAIRRAGASSRCNLPSGRFVARGPSSTTRKGGGGPSSARGSARSPPLSARKCPVTTSERKEVPGR
jgi:light-regulated signal transduction histidine kinase (bacteriophytochrome)